MMLSILFAPFNLPIVYIALSIWGNYLSYVAPSDGDTAVAFCWYNITTIHETQRLLTTMSRAEKVALLQLLAADLTDTFPGIERHPDICGRAACIVRTRIPVWLLWHATHLGTIDADLLNAYPTL